MPSYQETDPFLSKPGNCRLVEHGLELLLNGLSVNYLIDALNETPYVMSLPEYQRSITPLIAAGRSVENVRFIEQISDMSSLELLELEGF